jgi:ABC-type multidrug transport system fused ATPase/permease subunit
MNDSDLDFTFPEIGPAKPTPTPKPPRTFGSYIYGSLIAGTAIEFFVVAAVTALLCWLFILLEKPDNFPSLFPLQTDFAFVFLLAVIVVGYFEVRFQQDYYSQVLIQLNQINHGLRRMVRSGKMEPANASMLLTTVKEGILNKPDMRISAAFETVDSEVVSNAAQMLESNLYLLERSPISILSQITIYIWAFALPWFYWGFFGKFVILLVPFAALPFLALRQYGCKLRYKGRKFHEGDPFWEALTKKLNFSIDNPPLKG